MGYRLLSVDRCEARAECRMRRKRSLPDKDHELYLELDAGHLAEHLFGEEESFRVGLRRTSGLLAPNYKLVVRDGENVVSVNTTVPYPTCLYEGGDEQQGGSRVAISTCYKGRLVGTVLSR